MGRTTKFELRRGCSTALRWDGSTKLAYIAAWLGRPDAANGLTGHATRRRLSDARERLVCSESGVSARTAAELSCAGRRDANAAWYV